MEHHDTVHERSVHTVFLRNEVHIPLVQFTSHTRTTAEFELKLLKGAEKDGERTVLYSSLNAEFYLSYSEGKLPPRGSIWHFIIL